nr:unnamed protein product [Digitaria exilis]
MAASDAPGGEGTKRAPQQLPNPLAVTHERQESKPREAAGVIVSFGARPAVAAAAPPRPRKLTTVLVVDKARLCCSLCSLPLKRPIYQLSSSIPRFGAIHPLRVPAAGADRLLVVAEEEEGAAEGKGDEEEDDEKDDAEAGPAVFVLSVRARGEAAAVSVACVRANARAGPQYKCVVWAKAPAPRGGGAAGRAGRRLCMETDVPSCAQPGEAAVEDGMWLGVAPVMVLGASREIQLSVRIDKL